MDPCAHDVWPDGVARRGRIRLTMTMPFNCISAIRRKEWLGLRPCRLRWAEPLWLGLRPHKLGLCPCSLGCALAVWGCTLVAWAAPLQTRTGRSLVAWAAPSQTWAVPSWLELRPRRLGLRPCGLGCALVDSDRLCLVPSWLGLQRRQQQRQQQRWQWKRQQWQLLWHWLRQQRRCTLTVGAIGCGLVGGFTLDS